MLRTSRAPGWRPSLLFAALTANAVLVACLAMTASPVGLQATVSRWSAPGAPRGERLYTAIDSELTAASLGRLRQKTSASPVIIQWDGVLHIVEARDYEIALAASGRFTVMVDGRPLLHRSADDEAIDMSRRLPLGRGSHAIAIVLEPADGDAVFALRRSGQDGLIPVPVGELSPAPLSDRAWTARRHVPTLMMAMLVAWPLLLCLLAGGTIRRVLPPTDLFDDWRVRTVLGLALVLFFVGVWWGLPGPSWALDEIAPVDVEAGWERGFRGGWHDKFPPLHYYLMALAQAPVFVADRLALLAPALPLVDATRYLALRLLTVFMGVGMLMSVARLADRVAGRDVAWLAVFCAACGVPLAYYAKTTNLDVPYAFWFVLSMVFYAEAVRSGHLRDLVSFGVTSALAVTTKDQAYGLYALPVLYLVWQMGRRRLAALALAATASALTFALAHNLAFNYLGFTRHIEALLGPASQNYRMFPPTPDGQLALAFTTASLMPWMLGWGGLAAATIGLIGAWRPNGRVGLPVWLHLPALSYYVSFLAVVGYVYDRFLLPITILLAIAMAVGLRKLLDGGARPLAGRLLATIILASLAWRALSIDALLLRDSRYEVERWLQANAPSGAVIGIVQQRVHLPRVGGFRDVEMTATVGATDAVRPDFIVVNADHLGRYAPGSPRRVWLAWLESPTSPYVEVLRHRSRLRWSAFRWSPIFQDDVESPTTNMDKVNPEIVVFQRRGAG